MSTPHRNTLPVILLTVLNVVWLAGGITLVVLEWPVLSMGSFLLPQTLLLYYQPVAFAVVSAAVIATVVVLVLVRARAGDRLYALWKYGTFAGLFTLLAGPLSLLTVFVLGVTS